MKTKEAIDLFQSYQKSTHKKRTLQSYLPLLLRFGSQYGETAPENHRAGGGLPFPRGATAGRARSTRRLRYAQLKAFYNFIINRCDFEMRNPCSASLFQRPSREPSPSRGRSRRRSLSTS